MKIAPDLSHVKPIAPPCRVISNGRKSLYEHHTAFDRGILCQDGSCSVQQLSTLAVVKSLTRSVFLYTTVTFYRFHSVFHSSLLALTLNNFLCDDLFCFCKPILSRSVNKYCWF